jgi:GNAT superfamily N-acetyltransferase
MADTELLRRVDRTATAATERDREVQDFGPFRALLDPTTDLVYMNYAVARGAFEEAALRRLVQHFEHTRQGIAARSLRCALATVEAQPAGVGTTTPLAGVAELAGVGTLERFRRRGIASAVSSVLLADHFRDGDVAWLSAGDDAAEAVYRKLGFERAGWRLAYIL